MSKTVFTTVICFALTAAVFISAAAQGDKAVQAQTVEITEQGYQPESIKLKVNVPARLTFVRRTDKTCVREIVIQEYDLKRELPLHEPVVFELTPRKSGEFTFACGMGMLRGKLIVQ